MTGMEVSNSDGAHYELLNRSGNETVEICSNERLKNCNRNADNLDVEIHVLGKIFRSRKSRSKVTDLECPTALGMLW